MVFSSQTFLFFFLPLAGLCVLIRSKPVQNAMLLIASLIFYAWGEPKMVVLMVLVTLVAYGSGFAIVHFEARPRAKKAALIAAIVVILGNLVVFKYLSFLFRTFSFLGLTDPGIALPIGISFYTFSAGGYLIDVYRGTVAPERSLLTFGTYLTMFPKLVSGPIASYAQLQPEFGARDVSLRQTVDGLKLFVFGMALKILLANQLGGLWSDVTTIGFESLSTPLAWMAAFAYSFQLYFDFWGYSLMAIGIGRMLGFHLPENFRCPYLALSMTEFWRRWHITLGTWFRNYLYFPLGGSRCSRGRMIFNLLVVWLATGLWHGAHLNFLLWGLGLFVILTVEKLWLKKYLDRWPVLGHLYMLVLIPLSWAVFSVSDLGQLGAYFGRLLPLFSHTAAAYPLDFLKYGKTYGVFLVLGLVCSTSLPAYLYRRLKGTWAGAVILAVLFWLCLFCLSKGMNDPFMYFRF